MYIQLREKDQQKATVVSIHDQLSPAKLRECEMPTSILGNGAAFSQNHPDLARHSTVAVLGFGRGVYLRLGRRPHEAASHSQAKRKPCDKNLGTFEV